MNIKLRCKNILRLTTKCYSKTKGLKRHIRVLLALPIDTGEAIFMDSYRLRMGMPLDKIVMRETKEAMIANEWEVLYDRPNPDGWYPNIVFAKNVGTKRYQVEFVYFPFNEGSTCVRQKIGSETVEQDVYEIVCKEGAEE